MRKSEVNKIERSERAKSLFIICNLIISILAISFLIGLQGSVVSAELTFDEFFDQGFGDGNDYEKYTSTGTLPDKTKASSSTPVPAGLPVALSKAEVDVGYSVESKVIFKEGSAATITQGGTDYVIKSAQLLEGEEGLGWYANVGGKSTDVTADLVEKGLIDGETLKPVDKFVEGTQSSQGGLKGIYNKILAGPQTLIQGVIWAGVAYSVVGWLGPKLGLSPEVTRSLQYASSAGLFSVGAVNQFAKTGGLFDPSKGGLFGTIGGNPWVAGIVVGVIVFALTYEKVKYETVNFQCLPWEAPIGGNDCEKCNDGIHPCSEYRCKSLGQACDLVNEGTANELCVWKNPRDVNSPAIRPWEFVLTSGYKYTNTKDRPPAWGTEIARGSGIDPCIEAFKPITFGIQTDKPAQCKIDLVRGSANSSNRDVSYLYDNMAYNFGGSGLYDYNHSQTMNIPGPDSINSFANSEGNETSGGLILRNDGRYELYVRCRSANGYFNEDPYVIKFCVDKGPDTTSPVIEETSIRNNQPVQFEVDEIPIIVYTNEPSTCKWSKTNQAFDNLENNMSCARSPAEMGQNLLYSCSGTLNGIEDRKDNIFYFRCEDQPWKPKADRNIMSQSYVLTLKGTQPLSINEDSIVPEDKSNITGATTNVAVNLELRTEEGYNNGEAECYYSVGNENNYVPFFETNANTHRQRQDLREGTYTYYFKCIDLGGNQDRVNTTFNVKVDTQAPQITRIYYDANNLKITTDEEADCYYTNNEATKCNYNLDDPGINQMPHENPTNKLDHFSEWNLKLNYYIKCVDINGKQPLPNQCSIIVKPVEITNQVD